MSDWITDRRPTIHDTDLDGYVWITTDEGDVQRWHWPLIDNRPWMPIPKIVPPEPYIKPKRCLILLHNDGSELWKISMKGVGVPAHSIPTYEAAERIAAIYEEVMP